MPRATITEQKAVAWIGEPTNDTKFSFNFSSYEKFQFNNIIAGIGDFVLVSNADAAEPDTVEGCDAARIISLYEDRTNKNDPFRAKVQWYSKPEDLPAWCFNKEEPIDFLAKEVIEDHRPFNTDVSVETFFKKCTITLTFTKDTKDFTKDGPYHYICRHRLTALSKRKVLIEPVLEEERKAIELLCTPRKNMATPKSRTPKTPGSLTKRMSRVSLSEKNNWSISKNDGTKLLLRRAILTEAEKNSPKKLSANDTPKPTSATDTPRSSKKLNKKHIEEVLSMELKENSDEELPTLIIRQTPVTPKRKQSVSKIENTPKKVLLFDEENKECYSTRSGRITKNPRNYCEPELSPVKRTPKKATRKVDEADNDFEFSRTPKTPKTPRTPRVTNAKTPRSISRKILTSQLTPSLHSRAHSVDNIDDFIKENKSLPGRESQMEEILSFVQSKLADGSSGCMYISGVPGTGKTATVCTALKFLKEDVELPDFQLVEVNGMKIAEPRQAYVHIYKQLTGKSVVWEQACSLLEKRFTNPGPRRIPTVLLVDELDALCTRRQDVVYSIMEWTGHSCAQLTVLAVANTMDLPERALAARVASRLGLTRLTFPPYTHRQLQDIVVARLANANVTPDAIQLIARKVAAVSGDARRALTLCSRALALGGAGGAGLAEVSRALAETTAAAAVRAIQACSPAEILMLRATAAEVERTGSDETTVGRALLTAGAIVSLDGRPYRSAAGVRPPTPAQARHVCARLAAARLLLLEPKPDEPRLLLNCDPDDVHYATKQIAF